MSNIDHDTVLIIDAGSQYCKLIDRVVRELNIRSEVVGLNITARDIISKKYRAIVISGGPMSVADDEDFESVSFDESILDIGLPILGICFGMQLITKIHGGKVLKTSSIENSQISIQISDTCALYKDMNPEQTVLLTHSDSCVEVPNFFKINAKTSSGTIASISNDQAKIYGVQFHPEVDLTINGKHIFKNFLFDIAGCKATFTQENKLDLCARVCSNIPKDKNIIVLVSGGVDSTVCASLVKKLCENKTIFMMIDNGLLRENECASVKEAFKLLGIDIMIVEAGEIFMNASTFVDMDNFKNVSRIRSSGSYNPNNKNSDSIETFDERKRLKIEIGTLRIQILPENKRMIIGDTFMNVIYEAMRNLGLSLEDSVLVQGTLRPDVIESGSPFVSKNAHVIKTHHNDSGAVRSLRKQGKIVEPLVDFHKDEVRAFAKILDIPEFFMHRRPFPGPGLAVRILCLEKLKITSMDDRFDVPILAGIVANFHQRSSASDGPVYKFIKESLSPLEYEKLLECTNVPYTFSSTLLPILSVGVQGDCRTYKNGIALSTNAVNIDWEKLAFVAKVIPKICTSINRVVYAFGSPIIHPVTSITLTFLSPESIQLSRRAHAIVDNIFYEKNIKTVSQCPVVLIPIQFDLHPNKMIPSMRRSLVLRPFITRDFMTGVPAVPNKDIPEDVVDLIKNKLLELPMVSRVLYDLTPKPPGTTEWE